MSTREAILENKEVTAFTATDSYMRERAQEREMLRQEFVEKQKALNPRRRGYGDLETGLEEKRAVHKPKKFSGVTAG
jgi:hypothetical protein